MYVVRQLGPWRAQPGQGHVLLAFELRNVYCTHFYILYRNYSTGLSVQIVVLRSPCMIKVKFCCTSQRTFRFQEGIHYQVQHHCTYIDLASSCLSLHLGQKTLKAIGSSTYVWGTIIGYGKGIQACGVHSAQRRSSSHFDAQDTADMCDTCCIFSTSHCDNPVIMQAGFSSSWINLAGESTWGCVQNLS